LILVAFANRARAAIRSTPWTPMRIAPRTRGRRAAGGICSRFLQPRGRSSVENTATKPIMTGRKRPAPHAGDHFWTRTSKSAKAAAARAPYTTAGPVRPDCGPLPPRLRNRIPALLSAAAIQMEAGTRSPRRPVTRKATRTTLMPMTGVATETSPR
jgi:hypothetical protein